MQATQPSRHFGVGDAPATTYIAAECYGLFTTTFVAALLVFNSALTLWIWEACSLSWATKLSIPLLSSLMVFLCF
jgi:hypothetical protein